MLKFTSFVVAVTLSFFQAQATYINSTSQEVISQDLMSEGMADPEEAFEDDPFEGFNRVMFEFNHMIDALLLKPVAMMYRDVIPDFLQDRVHEGLQNLSSPLALVNDLLQGDMDRAVTTVTRFILNTVFGVGGVFDVAKECGIESRQQDFGQTLGKIGVGDGPYIVLPLLGPSNSRDTLGVVVDWLADPVNRYLKNIRKKNLIHTRLGLETLDGRSRALPLTDHLDKRGDPYVHYRAIYTQNRRYRILNEKPNTQDSPRPFNDDF